MYFSDFSCTNYMSENLFLFNILLFILPSTRQGNLLNINI
ncbi:CRPV-007 [Crowpox virus]|nr:CRPV-007 [Crowpox virus]